MLEFEPVNAGDSAILQRAAARFRGLTILITIGPRVPLARPRSTLGYVLTRASRVSPTSPFGSHAPTAASNRVLLSYSDRVVPSNVRDGAI